MITVCGKTLLKTNLFRVAKILFKKHEKKTKSAKIQCIEKQ